MDLLFFFRCQAALEFCPPVNPYQINPVDPVEENGMVMPSLMISSLKDVSFRRASIKPCKRETVFSSLLHFWMYSSCFLIVVLKSFFSSFRDRAISPFEPSFFLSFRSSFFFPAKGIGGELIKEGLRLLSESDVDLVFVLGHPDYYPRHGFKPNAGALGFEAPYPIPTEHADAWMVQELNTGVIGTLKGKVICADELDKPEHWRE